MAGIHNLRPSIGNWTLARLINNITTHCPHVLDPLLKGLQEMYGRGLYHYADGYMPDPDLIAKRAKSLQAHSLTHSTASGQKPLERANEESDRTKRPASTSPEKSSTCGSNVRRSRSYKCQKPPPHFAGGTKLSYDNSLHRLF